MEPIGLTGPGPGRSLPTLASKASRQLPRLKASERDTTMSEQQTTGFMQELDQWTEENIFAPLLMTDEQGESEELSDKALEQVRFAIRHRVLESYKNGIKAGYAKAHETGRKERKYAPAQNR